MKIGVISDTHGYLDPSIPALFAGVEHILHAGDIGSAKIILDLEQIAPVTAVLGNTDSLPGFREFELVILDQLKFILHHIVHPPALVETLQKRLDRERPHVVIFGHTHKPYCERIGDTLFFNPGYAGQDRFGLKRTLGILVADRGKITPEIIPL